MNILQHPSVWKLVYLFIYVSVGVYINTLGAMSSGLLSLHLNYKNRLNQFQSNRMPESDERAFQMIEHVCNYLIYYLSNFISMLLCLETISGATKNQ